MKRSVTCYKIQFAEKASEISVIGADALAWFAQKMEMNALGSEPYVKYADKSTEDIGTVIVEVDLPDDWLDCLDFTEQKIKVALEKKTGFKINSFSFCVK